MEYAVRGTVPSDDIAFRIDRASPAKDSSRDINRGELGLRSTYSHGLRRQEHNAPQRRLAG